MTNLSLRQLRDMHETLYTGRQPDERTEVDDVGDDTLNQLVDLVLLLNQ